MFECSKCGCCCRNLKMSEIYSELDRGDGVCKYLEGNLCSIYDRRPDICRVDKCYDLFFKDSISLKDYYKLNKEMCRKLKDLEE